MKTTVELQEKSYNILIENTLDLLSKHIAEFNKPSSITILSDSNVSKIYGDKIKISISKEDIPVNLYTFPAGENSKCFEQANKIYDYLISNKVDRKGIVLALGGGVTGDLAGFIAATYMRGLRFVQVPTSLLALVDSSVGGKVAINHPKGKNMIGCFYQPVLVYAGLEVLSTLPDVEFSSGMAEVIKHGIIKDKNYFSFLQNNIDKIMSLDKNTMAAVIEGSCKIKAEVVSLDEKENGLRAILNFGHTAGHAFEALTSYTGYRHGEAVSIGMIVACKLSERLTGFSKENTDNIESLLKKVGLPVRFKNLAPDEIYNSMLSDKKTEQGIIRFVLAKEIGEVEIVPVTEKDKVIEAIEAVCE